MSADKGCSTPRDASPPIGSRTARAHTPTALLGEPPQQSRRAQQQQAHIEMRKLELRGITKPDVFPHPQAPPSGQSAAEEAELECAHCQELMAVGERRIRCEMGGFCEAVASDDEPATPKSYTSDSLSLSPAQALVAAEAAAAQAVAAAVEVLHTYSHTCSRGRD